MNHATGKNSLTSPAERLREQTAVIGEDLHELGRLTSEAAREKVEKTKQAASAAYQEGQKRLSTFVESQPLRALAIALAAGAVLGFVYGRRR